MYIIDGPLICPSVIILFITNELFLSLLTTISTGFVGYFYAIVVL